MAPHDPKAPLRSDENGRAQRSNDDGERPLGRAKQRSSRAGEGDGGARGKSAGTRSAATSGVEMDADRPRRTSRVNGTDPGRPSRIADRTATGRDGQAKWPAARRDVSDRGTEATGRTRRRQAAADGSFPAIARQGAVGRARLAESDSVRAPIEARSGRTATPVGRRAAGPHDQPLPSSPRRAARGLASGEASGGQSQRPALNRRASRRYTADGRKRFSHQQTFVVGAVGLLVAVVLNSGALLTGAETKPFGPARDRSVRLWSAVDDIANTFSLNRPRDVLASAVGKDGDSGLDPTRSFADPGADVVAGGPLPDAGAGPTPVVAAPTTTTTAPVVVEIRRGTTADPLRVWVGGDSMSKDMAASFAQRSEPLGPSAVETEGRVVSGLNRLDYFDWIGRLTELSSQPYEVMVAMFGANDLQGMQVGEEVYPVLSDGWKKEYAARVGAAMEQLTAGGRVAYWIELPPMRSPEFDQKVQQLNQLMKAEADKNPRVVWVETAGLLGDGAGGYAEFGRGTDGESHELRQADGIHLSLWGANLVADAVIADIVGRQPEAPLASVTTTTAAAGTPAATAAS